MAINIPRPYTTEYPATAIAPEAYVIPLAHQDAWLEETNEGELAVDVHETADCFVVQSTVAGTRPDDLTLSLHRDLLTIRGTRHRPTLTEGALVSGTPLTTECYWGPFSRSLLLPEPVDTMGASATLRYGVLTIVLPKLREQTTIDVTETSEEPSP